MQIMQTAYKNNYGNTAILLTLSYTLWKQTNIVLLAMIEMWRFNTLVHETWVFANL